MTASTVSRSMTRRSALIATGLLGAGVALGAARSQSAVAQDDVARPPDGVIVETLSAGASTLVPGKTLVLLRITMHPEASTAPRPQPGPVALHVDRGVLDINQMAGEALVTRALVDGMWASQRDLSPGDSTRLGTGDQLFHDGSTVVMHNSGPDRLILLVSTLLDAGETPASWLAPA